MPIHGWTSAAATVLFNRKISAVFIVRGLFCRNVRPVDATILCSTAQDVSVASMNPLFIQSASVINSLKIESQDAHKFMHVCEPVRDSGHVTTHTPLATVSLATLIRRRGETPAACCRRLFHSFESGAVSLRQRGEEERRSSVMRSGSCAEMAGGGESASWK